MYLFYKYKFKNIFIMLYVLNTIKLFRLAEFITLQIIIWNKVNITYCTSGKQKNYNQVYNLTHLPQIFTIGWVF